MTDTHAALQLCIAAALLFTVGAARATDADAEALGLQAEAEAPPPPAAAPMKLLIEGAVGYADRRYGLDSRATSRASVDFRGNFQPHESIRAVLSSRVDAIDPPDPRIDGAVFSLREAYLGWQDASAAYVADAGRVNLRQGPGYGYNPTDFFRDNALRTITTVDPFTLRENRLGSVMLRAQRLWSGASVEAAFSPKLATSPSNAGFSADLGSTNARDRGLVVLNNRWSETLNTQLSTYKERGAQVKWGASATGLLSSAVVAHLEWSSSHESTLLSRAIGQPSEPGTGQRLAAGFTYTTASRLSVTAEYERNDFALDRDGWIALAAAGPTFYSPYFQQALALQDNSARQAWLLYAVQRDLGLKNLDLTVLLKFNSTDRSRMTWLDVKYRLDRVDLALQVQHNAGVTGSEFGSATTSLLTSLVATFYF